MTTPAYQCILADPPWPEHGGGRRGAQNHYPLLKLRDIPPLMMQHGTWKAAESCHLWMWAPSRTWMALQVIQALGFEQKTFVPWVKVSDPKETLLREVIKRVGQAFAAGARNPHKLLHEVIAAARKTQPGLDQYIRHDSELLLFATRGPAMVPESAYQTQAILAPKQEHSRKPEEAYELIEHVSPGPRLEMFARRSRPGWDVWGNEVTTGADGATTPGRNP